MHVRTAVFFIFVAIVVSVPNTAHATVSEPFVYSAYLNGMPTIAGAPYGTFQTALRANSTPTIQVLVHSQFGIAPTLLADLSDFGLSASATTSGEWAGYAAKYYPAYFYDFGPLSVSATPDGIYDIPIIATDMVNGTSSMTMSITVDNVSPTISLSDVSFSSSSPQQYQPIYLSGSANGTGSAIRVASIDQMLIDAHGATMPYGYASSIATSNIEALDDAFASSTDTTFTRVPVTLFWGGANTQIDTAVSLKIILTAYDEAGYVATATFTVPLPKPDPCIAAGNCVSNVLFLPGIEGSRLYEGIGCGKAAEEKLWDPIDGSGYDAFLGILRGVGDDKIADLSLDVTGASACADMYAKEGDIIDAVGGSTIYASLVGQMDGLKADGTITDWEPVPYDWRLSLDDLLNKGAERAGKIYYTEATSTPYIEQTLRALAASSKTGKVTIIAHSNGGLLTKALLNRLGDETATALVDKVIMIGVPQSGAPQDVGALLVGHSAGIYVIKGLVPIVSNAAARAFMQNSPMAYHLLPSQSYFDITMEDTAHPVARFTGNAFAAEETAYGNTIDTATELRDFLIATDGGREKPAISDLSSLEIVNSELITYANTTHDALDAWVPPAGIAVSQIAGWGVDTVGGIDFYSDIPTSLAGPLTAVNGTGFDVERKYRPIIIEDGDGTVPVPSALLMAPSANVKRYWLDLHAYSKLTSIKHTHKDLFEVPSLRDFIHNLLQNSTSTLPSYISMSQPPPAVEDRKITFFLHSPLTLQITDASGNVTGLSADGSVTEDIPSSTYGEFGEVKYITVPQGNTYQLALHGQASGTFSLDIQESSGGIVTASSSVANVPTTASTLASLTISSGIDTASVLAVDEDGDGEAEISLALRVGETLRYQPSEPALEPTPEPEPEPASQPEPQTPRVRSSGGAYAAPVAAQEPAATTTDSARSIEPGQVGAPQTNLEQTTTTIPAPRVATSSLAVVSPVPSAYIRNKASVLAQIAAPEDTYSPKTEKQSRPIPQTASVYDASQQPLLKKWGTAVYNGLYGFWSAVKNFFNLK